AILSTGKELVPHSAVAKDHLVKDVNGPFLETALRNLGVEAQFWGVIGDECGSFVDLVSNRLRGEDVDVVISTGAVSMGRFDFVEAGLDQLGGEARFHRVNVRPGHPILFGVIPRLRYPNVDELEINSQDSEEARQVAFFGLPGNPMAC